MVRHARALTPHQPGKKWPRVSWSSRDVQCLDLWPLFTFQLAIRWLGRLVRIGIRQAPRGDRRAGRGAISHLSACSVTSRKWKRRDGNLSQRRPRFNHSTFSCPPQADPANCRLALRRQLRQAFCDDEGEKNLRPPLIASIKWSCALVSYMPFKWSWFCPTSPPWIPLLHKKHCHSSLTSNTDK